MAAEASGSDLIQVVALLAAGVIAVPIFKRAGPRLGARLSRRRRSPSARSACGSSPIRKRSSMSPNSASCMFLFIIGLEMEPSRLWGLRKRDLRARRAAGRRLRRAADRRRHAARASRRAVAFVAGMGFVLTSTAIVMQLLTERGELATPGGQKIVSILLLEDLAIVPLLAIVALLSPPGGADDGDAGRSCSIRDRHRLRRGRSDWSGRPLAAQPAVPHPRQCPGARGDDGGGAAGRARRGAAVMQFGGLSMAMGAFLAGVLLSDLDLPPPARSRHRAVPRHPARPVLPRRRHVARPQCRRRELAAHRALRRLLHGGEGRSAIYVVARLLKIEPSPRRWSARC